MFRIARKSALLLATLTTSLSMSSIARADNPQQQFQPYQQYTQPANQQYLPTQYSQNNNQQSQSFAPQLPAQQQYQPQQVQPQFQPPQQYQQPSNFTPPAQNAVAEDRISDDQLGAILSQLGYNPQPLHNNAGGTSYTVKIDRGDWHFTVTVGISSDRTNLWLSQPLTKLPEGSSLSTQALLKMMEWNASSTSIFSYEPNNGNRLLIAKPTANHGVSAAKVRSELESFIVTIEQTESLWSEKALTVSNTTAMR